MIDFEKLAEDLRKMNVSQLASYALRVSDASMFWYVTGFITAALKRDPVGLKLADCVFKADAAYAEARRICKSLQR